MFLVNGQKAILRKYKKSTDVFDDREYEDVIIKCCPYNVDQGIMFGKYTIPEATGYYQVSRFIDVKEGDQIYFVGKSKETTFNESKCNTILKVQDEWCFNRVENYILAVK